MRKRKKTRNLGRKEYYLWMRRIFKLLGSGEWEVRLVRIFNQRGGALSGFINPGEKIIYIDVTHDIIPTIIHECLHAYFVDSMKVIKKEETTAQEIEFFLVLLLTPLHIIRLRNYLLTDIGLLAPKFPLVYYDRD